MGPGPAPQRQPRLAVPWRNPALPGFHAGSRATRVRAAPPGLDHILVIADPRGCGNRQEARPRQDRGVPKTRSPNRGAGQVLCECLGPKLHCEARQGLSVASKDKAPAGSRRADQGCAGRRGDGGWGEPARQRFNVRCPRGFQRSVRFLRDAAWSGSDPARLSRGRPAAPPGWSGPARNRPRCRLPAFAPSARGPGARGS